MSNFRAMFKKWFWRYVKYNAVGLTVFLLNIAIYALIFPYIGEWSYIIVSVNGGIIEFTLIAYVNKTKKGIIFESCSPIETKSVEGPK
jgi:hypothetical protein